MTVLVCLWSAAAWAGPVIDRVKSEGVVRCGSVERAGLAEEGGDGAWRGVSVDVCRAVAAAVLGQSDRIAFGQYETPKQFERVRSGEDELFFLTGSEIAANGLAGRVLPGPTVFIESHAVMVPADSSAHAIGDLAGHAVCFMIASPVERSLNAYFAAHQQSWIPMGYSEDGEMVDAYNVRRCAALASETTALAALVADKGVLGFANRILPQPLTVFPVMAATGTTDAQWSAIVAWTIHTLVSGERPAGPWYPGGAAALPLAAPELGLDKDWQPRVLAAVGHMADIYERHLGGRAPIQLPRGLNANQVEGGLLLSPFLE